MTYPIIYADPPWSYDDKMLHRGGAARHYKTMDAQDIAGLPIAQIAAPDAVLFMWATFPKLPDALQVMWAWGFQFKTCAFVWLKTNKNTNTKQTSFLPAERLDTFWGMGRWTRANAEVCLLGTRGKPQRTKAGGGVHQVVYAPVSKHSRKPDEVRDRIVTLCGDLPRLELFARRPTPGWDVFGNEVEGSIQLIHQPNQ